MAILKTEIYKLITDNDGSCRDINFEGVKWHGIESYIKKLSDTYSDVKIQVWKPDEEAIEVDCKDFINNILETGTSAQIYAEDINNIIQQLQIYIFTENNGQPFLELTFFPQDINLSADEMEKFLNLVKDWSDTFKATQFFVRYENASWKFGDTSKYSGVIYTSEMEIA